MSADAVRFIVRIRATDSSEHPVTIDRAEWDSATIADRHRIVHAAVADAVWQSVHYATHWDDNPADNPDA